jgi:hypothetical protein
MLLVETLAIMNSMERLMPFLDHWPMLPESPTWTFHTTNSQGMFRAHSMTLMLVCQCCWWTIITSMVIFLMCLQHFKCWTYLRINLMEAFQHIILQSVHYLSNICKCFEFSSLQDLKCLFIAMNLFYLKESFVDSSFNQKN